MRNAKHSVLKHLVYLKQILLTCADWHKLWKSYSTVAFPCTSLPKTFLNGQCWCTAISQLDGKNQKKKFTSFHLPLIQHFETSYVSEFDEAHPLSISHRHPLIQCPPAVHKFPSPLNSMHPTHFLQAFNIPWIIQCSLFIILNHSLIQYPSAMHNFPSFPNSTQPIHYS